MSVLLLLAGVVLLSHAGIAGHDRDLPRWLSIVLAVVGGGLITIWTWVTGVA